jgi:hypothetical protein
MPADLQNDNVGITATYVWLRGKTRKYVDHINTSLRENPNRAGRAGLQ